MAKLDLQNAFWSAVLPRGWRRVFVVQTADGRLWRYTRLPFGWRYSPLIYQSLVRGIVAAALRGVRARAWVYIDDILVTARSPPEVQRAVRLIIRRLQRAGFIISQKSETTPTMELGFIGKHINTEGGYFQNAPGGLRSALRAWVRAMGRGTIEPRRLRKLLGQLCWLSRPNTGLSCFIAGSYQALDSGGRRFTRSMARGLGTLLFSAVAQSYPPDAHEGGMQQVPGKRHLLLFADAAPDEERFRVGLVGDKRFRRSIPCQAWVTSLQQAELFGIYYACKVAVYRGHRSVVVGTDSDASRFQVAGQRATACSQAHQRILRRLFWLQLWSHVKLGVFWVDAAENPADPLSRLFTFPSRRHAAQDANDRRQL